MTPRDVWKGGSRISLAVCRPWRTWHCALKRAHLGFSGVRVTTFSSAGRPPPLVRAEEVSAPLKGSIRTRRRAKMRAEVEARPEAFGEGERGQGWPSPLSRQLQQFGASSRQEDVPIDIRRSHMHAERSVQLSSTIAKQCAYLRTWLVEMMKTPQPTVFVFKKVDTTTLRPL